MKIVACVAAIFRPTYIFFLFPSCIIVAVYQPKFLSTHVRLAVCVCVSVFEHNNF